MSELKLTKVERDQDAVLETFIHRLAVNKIASYEDCFSQLGSRQCMEMRQSYMQLHSKGDKKPDGSK